MSSNQIHPRLLARIREVLEGRQEQILDTQVGVYSRLCKATKLLNDSRHPAGLDATATCAASAQAIREYARDDRLGDEDSLRKIYDDLDRVSTVICSALGIGPAMDSPASEAKCEVNQTSISRETSG